MKGLAAAFSRSHSLVGSRKTNKLFGLPPSPLPSPPILKKAPSFSRFVLLFALFSMASSSSTSASSSSSSMSSATSPAAESCETRAPAIFLSHGGGPCFFMEGGMMTKIDKNSPTADWYRNLASKHFKTKPKAIIIISAHWEEDKIHVTSNPNPKLYFDYYGFPAFTYKLTYPAPMDVALATRINDILNKNGVPSVLDHTRDYDHGVFVPLKLIYPEADVPLVQISLNANLDAAFHYKLGQLLEPLRNEGYLVMGSGYATHNMRELMGTMGMDDPMPHTEQWIDWLKTTVANPNAEERKNKLIKWTEGPYARRAHPREEHLLPLHVVAGAAHGSKTGGKEIYSLIFGTSALNCYLFE